jgi:hypothetical protein
MQTNRIRHAPRTGRQGVTIDQCVSVFQQKAQFSKRFEADLIVYAHLCRQSNVSPVHSRPLVATRSFTVLAATLERLIGTARLRVTPRF